MEKLEFWMASDGCHESISIQAQSKQIASSVILIQFLSNCLSKWISLGVDTDVRDLDDSNRDIDIDMDFKSWISHHVFSVAVGLSS